MPSYQLLRCKVALAGDPEQVVSRHRGRPIVFPELPILQFLHGEDAVTEIAVVGEWSTTNEEVLERLRVTYQPSALNAVYPGTKPRLPVADSTLPLCTQPVYVAPPTRPDNPDPVLKSLDQFTMTTAMPVIAGSNPELADPIDGVSLVDTMAAHREDAEAADFADLDDELGLRTAPPKPAMPDPAAFRNRHNVRGEGSSAPRTADHLPDVENMNRKPAKR